MRIRSKLILNTGIILAMMGFITAALLLAFQEAKNAHRSEMLIIEIKSGFNQMSVLRNEYLLRHEERAKIQWGVKAEETRKILGQAEKFMTDTRDQMALKEIRIALDLSVFLFTSLSEYFDNAGNIEKRFFSFESKRMISQIIANNYNLITESNTLLESVQKRSEATLKKTAVIMILLMVLAVLATVGNSLSINRTLSKRITALNEGVQIIGNGNLGHQIAIEGKDELTELAMANNNMAIKLMNSYTNIENLKREMMERSQVEEELRLSEERLHNMYQESPIPTFTWQKRENDFILVEFNRAAIKLTDGRVKDHFGASARELYKDRPKILDDLNECFNERSILKREITSRHFAAGRFLYVQYGFIPPDLVIVHTDDQTERKRAEDEIRKLNAELEQRVASRTAELAERARQMETFTYSVSHDLKTPLRGIDGYSRLLQEDYSDRLDEQGRTFIRTIRQATEQMRQLIEDLLAYSRMERRSMSSQEVRPLALMQNLLLERAADVHTRNVSVTVNIPDVVIKADPNGLAQVLRNLLDNALKFTGKTSDPHIEIGGEEKEKSCILWVRDNGIGFDMRYHDRIFEIFQRLNPVDDYPGTGIGMAIVQKAIQRMGGRVWAESTPDKGATFYLEVPR